MAAAWILALLVFSGAVLSAQEPLKVSEASARQAVASKQDPTYPPLARQMRISGSVTVEAVIDADGKVAQCQPVSGNPVLTAAATSAVKKWTFKPFAADGKPARAVTRLTFNFGA